MAERDASGAWRGRTMRRRLRDARAIGAALLARGLSAERPVAILSGNSVAHAMLALACLHVGIPYAPISTAYSLLSGDHAKLRHVFSVLTPGLVFADDGSRYAAALDLAGDAEIVVCDGRAATRFDALCATTPGPEVDAAARAIDPDAPAKFLFTSGSTGLPKAVINTQPHAHAATRRCCAPPSRCSRRSRPSSSTGCRGTTRSAATTMSGSCSPMAARSISMTGGPWPGAIEATVRNLREIAPTIFFNVPKGFEELMPYLRREPALREKLFSRVKMIFFSGAGPGAARVGRMGCARARDGGRAHPVDDGARLDRNRAVRAVLPAGCLRVRHRRPAGLRAWR